MSSSAVNTPQKKQVASPGPSSTASGAKDNKETFLGLVVTVILLIGICYVAYTIRLYAVTTYGRVIHEFDPWFNFRATQYLVDNGLYKFWNWFDDQSWYPIGRHVGSTLYPGMMITAWLIHMFLNAVGFDVSINDVCVFIPAGFACLTCLSMYLLAKEISGSRAAAVAASAIMAIIPAHMMRSVAGGFDNESVAVFAIVFTFYLWIRSVRDEQSWPWGFATALSYIYMVSAWGAYTFVINMIGIHAGVLFLLGRYSSNLHKAYSIFWSIGTAGALIFPIVGWQPVSSLEQMGPLLLFVFFQIWAFIELSRPAKADDESMRKFHAYRIKTLTVLGGIVALVFAILLSAGYLGAFSNRVRSLFIRHTRTGNALVDSVAEHQATDSAVFAQYFHNVYPLIPIGFVILLFRRTNASIFALIYTALAFYFSRKMVRLVLLLAAPAAVTSGVVVGYGAEFIISQLLASQNPEKQQEAAAPEPTKKKAKSSGSPYAPLYEVMNHPIVKLMTTGAGGLALASALLLFFSYSGYTFALHSRMMAEQLSHPQVMLSTRGRNGELIIIDDFREAYWWLRDNTPEDARVMAWWDYGYQINGIANRTTIADGNTWNFEHIALLGRTLISPEKEAWSQARHLADYVLVWTGRFIGYMSDDLAKMPQLANIAGSIYPEIDRQGYFVDRNSNPTPAARESLLYKLTFFGKDDGTIKLKHFKEVYTSKYSMVRIYKILDVAPRTPFGQYAPELKLGKFKGK